MLAGEFQVSNLSLERINMAIATLLCLTWVRRAATPQGVAPTRFILAEFRTVEKTRPPQEHLASTNPARDNVESSRIFES